jgi:hypothetical protein
VPPAVLGWFGSLVALAMGLVFRRPERHPARQRARR